MDQDDEVDIEGDFELKAGDLLGSICDFNELPSKSVNLQPEFSQHPWMLEQGFTLDHCSEEKSKAAIEKMLIEEQSYIEIKPVETHERIPTVLPEQKQLNNKQSSTRGKHWDDDEKAIFFKGLDTYGRKWSKIAEMIPTRTAEQVKHFGQHYYKMKAKANKKAQQQQQQQQQQQISVQNPTATFRTVVPSHAPTLEAMLKTVTTAQPTITMLTKPITTMASASLMPRPSLPKPIEPSKTGGKKRPEAPSSIKSPKRPLPKKQVKRSRSCENPVKKEVSEEIVRIVKSETHSEDEDIVIDIDSDREDIVYTKRSNLINALHLNGTEPRAFQYKNEISDSMDSYKEALDSYKEPFSLSSPPKDSLGLQSMLSTMPQITALGLSGDSVLIKEEGFSPDRMSTLPNIPEMDKLDTAHTIPSSDDSGFLPSLGTSDLSPSDLLNEAGLMSAEAKVELLTPTTMGSICRSSSSPDLHYLASTAMLEQGRSPLKYNPSIMMSSTVDSSFAFIGKGRGSGPMLSGRYSASEGGGTGPEERFQIDDFDNNEVSSGESETDEHPNEYGVVTSDGEVVYLTNPTEQKILGKEQISEEEKAIFAEFFDGRKGNKNAERYLKIRNYILESWEKTKPIYLNKTSVRPGLKNCGDVNCIGRIHSYLEQIGAINFGCNQVQYKKRGMRSTNFTKLCTKERERNPREIFEKFTAAAAAAKSDANRPRKRKVRELFTFNHWNDDEVGGRTIEHKSDGEEIAEERKPAPPRFRPKTLRAKHSATTNLSTNDPFKLVPCQAFSSTNPAPFHVEIESAVLVVMDTHAHLSKTEVIGLLGGRFLRDAGRLHITRAEPCDSLATGMQCEMDPVSQMQASEKILSKEATVVGWYHSHPTFEPNPSIRDLQTQEGFQSWFAEGGNPFVGIIISPYNRCNLSLCSQAKCIITYKEPKCSIGLPYQFDYNVSHTMWKRSKVAKKVMKLINKYSTYSNRVELLHYYKSINNITCIHKMIHSIEKWVDADVCGSLEPMKDEMLEKVTTQFSQSVAANRRSGAGAETNSSDTEHTTDSL